MVRAQGFPYHQQTFWPALPGRPQLHEDDEDADDGHGRLEDDEDAFL